MVDSDNYGHRHPLLLLLSEDQLTSNPSSGVSAECSRCGEKLSAPCFICAEDCRFYLHKVCAEAPLELNHPFHRHHPLVLLRQQIPHLYDLALPCYFCGQRFKEFLYGCRSCTFRIHIGCAMFTFNFAQSKLKELEHDALGLGGSLVCAEADDCAFKVCFWCREPAPERTYYYFHFRIHLHKNCSKLPFRINHFCHRKHPLFLQCMFQGKKFSCKLCQESISISTWYGGSRFFYGCSLCKFAIHFECASQQPPPVIRCANHQHPFALFWRQVPFICDACGTEGDCVSYTCDECNIIVHRNCISLPRVIKSKWHDHRLLHTCFFYRENFGTTLDCVICHDKVDTEHGSYSCSKCNVIFHVKCALKDEDLYSAVENEDEEPLDISVDSINVLEWNDAGEASLIEHFKHSHYLKLSDEVKKYDDKCCDGCLLSISTLFYHCSECEFFLHKVCAELPKVKEVWHHRCQQPLVLTSNEAFWCAKCSLLSNSFAYKCEECEKYTCLRCVIALTPEARTCPGHKHPLFFYMDNTGRCNACGLEDYRKGMLCCKVCGFSLHHECFSLPATAQHKCDEHLLSLTYHNDNSYSESHYCDICERRRDPNLWFYRCATCDTFVHVDCALGEYPFLKLRSIFQVGEGKGKNIHEHPLTVVKFMYYYPKNCVNCGKPCLDLAFECTKSGCNYITHIGCSVTIRVLQSDREDRSVEG